MTRNNLFIVVCMGVLIIACTVGAFMFFDTSTSISTSGHSRVSQNQKEIIASSHLGVLPRKDGFIFLYAGQTYSGKDFSLSISNSTNTSSSCDESDARCMITDVHISTPDDGTQSFLLAKDEATSFGGKTIIWRDTLEVLGSEADIDLFVFEISDQILDSPITYIGYLEDFQFGDYGHISIKDKIGNVRSFWLGDIPYEKLSIFIDGDVIRPEKQGEPVTVTWMRTKKFVPELGGQMYQDSIINIQ